MRMRGDMTYIEDMSETERESWVILIADSAILLWFWQKMTHGWNIQPHAMSLDDFGSLIIQMIVLTVIVHAVISSFFEVRKSKGELDRDERDREIERKGSHSGYRLLQFGVGSVIFIMFMTYGLEEDYQSVIRIKTPVEIIYYLLLVSYAADLLKHGVMIHAYWR